jgi:hypothetical protein
VFMPASVPVKRLAVIAAAGRLEGRGPHLQPEDNPNARRTIDAGQHPNRSLTGTARLSPFEQV